MEQPTRIQILRGDITQLAVDAIVNAANKQMLGGGGVDGAIHHAAGPDLLTACRAVPEVRRGIRCPTGEARITPGFALPAKYVIHTAGPVWRGGSHKEAQQLANCYRSCLRIAEENQVETIAFPAISTGVYGYPIVEATRIAVVEVREFLAKNQTIQQVIFVAYSNAAKATYEMAIANLQNGIGGRSR